MGGLNLAPDAVASVARRLYGEPNRKLSTRRELRFGQRGSLSIVLDRAVFHDHEAGVTGGLLDLVIHAGAARTRREAAALLESKGELYPRETVEDRARREFAEAKEKAERVARAQAIWNAASALRNTASENYLRRARSVAAPLSADALGFHLAAPVSPYRPGGRTCPALVAALTDHMGKLTGVHLTYLRSDGSGKADLQPSRKMAGVFSGSHVRLIPGPRLVVGEGLESTLSGWEAATRELGSSARLGAAAALSAGGMATFRWRAGTTALIIAHDADPSGTGERAARHLARRATADDLSVSLLPPPAGFSDWNDHVRAEGI